MSIADIKPHPEYAMLVRQFNALKTVLICKEKVEASRHADWKIYDVARKTLDSERAANAMLTEEIERLRVDRASIIEECAKWHDEQAEEWGKIAMIAAAKKDAVELQRANERALWHVADAQNIRALSRPAS